MEFLFLLLACCGVATLLLSWVQSGQLSDFKRRFMFGIGLLAAGIYEGVEQWHTASLTILLLTVTNVFLYDASELIGLYRVISFLGLGLSLIGISSVYSRLVFNKKT